MEICDYLCEQIVKKKAVHRELETSCMIVTTCTELFDMFRFTGRTPFLVANLERVEFPVISSGRIY